MITISRFRFQIICICGFLIFCLSLGGCSSSNVTDETSEEPMVEGSLEDEYAEGDDYGEGKSDELGLGDDEESEDEDFGDTELAEGLPDEAPLDLEGDPSLSDSEDAPLALEEEPGLPPVAEEDSGLPYPDESAGLPELPVDDQDQFAPEPYSSPSFDDSDVSFSQEGPRRIPVKKIKAYPYNRAGMLVNAVYIARSGDDLYSVSQKIYGADRTADLLAINPNLQRGVDVGDKVYYSSPSRPADSGSLLFYYEDVGVMPQQYTVGRGENIRDIASQLFGDSESWKELWATNLEIESKWGLSQGTVLRYWDASSAPAPPVASNQFVEEQPMPEVVQEENNFEPPPPPQEEVAPDLAGAAGNEFPPEDIPPPPDSGDTGEFVDNNEGFQEEPPPPALEPPPPLAAMGDQGQDEGGIEGLLEDENSLLFLVAGVVVIMLMLMIAIRRKAKRRKRLNIGDTQI